MSFNRSYGTRHSGRYNTPGHFVPAEQLPGSPMQRRLDTTQRINTPNANFNNSPVAALQPPPQFQPPQQPNMQALQTVLDIPVATIRQGTSSQLNSPMQRRLDTTQRINTPNANFNNSPVAALQPPPQFQPPQQPNMQALQTVLDIPVATIRQGTSSQLNSPMQRRLDTTQRINTPNANFNNSPVAALQPPPQFQPPQQPNMQALQVNDVEMKSDPSAADSKADGVVRPPWMESKLAGVKKISNKERRRRQNAHLRRLLSPKNALMALNELLLNEQIPNEFRVQQAAPAQFYNQSANMFCAELTVEGRVYKGYGETKITARNAAAEQAIRDIMIKKMSKIFNPEGSESGEGGAVGTGTGGPGTDGPGTGGPGTGGPGTGGPGTGGPGTDVSGAGGEEEALPMIQLASFALHKLFTEWECEGHKVPHLKPAPPPTEADIIPGDKKMLLEPRPKKKSKPRELPINAAAMHPCMLLTYMRPTQEYQDFATEGDRPQNMLFTIGVEVDGQVYLGKAPNKKEARKAAAKAACAALFNVTFHHNATATAPVHADNNTNNSNTNNSNNMTVEH